MLCFSTRSMPFTLKPIVATILCINATNYAHAQIVSPEAVLKKESKDVILPTIRVNANANINDTLITDGYRATTTRATKTLEDPQDIPQAITTVTKQLMEEQHVDSLRDALRNVSGLTFNAAEGGRSGDNMMLRGFYTFGDIYLDGVRDTAQYNRETFNTEQVDVLRGAAAMLYGRGQAGGVINQATKTPQLNDANKISTSIGTEQYYEGLGDFNKQLGETTAIRVNLMKRHEGSWRENPANNIEPETKREGVAIAIATGIDTRHAFSAAHTRTINRDRPDYGVSFNPTTHRINTRFPSQYYWGVDTNFDNSHTEINTLGYTYRLLKGGEIKTLLRNADYERAYWAKTPSATLAPSGTGGTGGNQTRTSRYQTSSIQTDFNKTFDIANMSHEILAGMELLTEDSYRQALLNQGTTTIPKYTKDAVTGISNVYKGNSKSIYVQDSIEFIQNWKGLFGIRKDWLHAHYNNLNSPSLDFSENSTRLGLSYQPNSNAHYYLSYSNSFSPTADLYQLSGGAYPAERSKVMELGAKWQLFKGNLALRAAVYRAEKNWERNTDLESSAAILTKQRRTNGLELEATGKITPQWEIFAGLSLINATITRLAENKNATTGIITYADSRLLGQKARNTPNYTLNVWSSYQITPELKLGGGAEIKGKRTVYNPSIENANALFTGTQFTPNTAPAYARLDLMASYEKHSWALRLNIKNITNKLYYDALYDNGGFGVPSNRRSVIITLEHKF